MVVIEGKARTSILLNLKYLRNYFKKIQIISENMYGKNTVFCTNGAPNKSTRLIEFLNFTFKKYPDIKYIYRINTKFSINGIHVVKLLDLLKVRIFS